VFVETLGHDRIVSGMGLARVRLGLRHRWHRN
jgi:hypothetical protein